MKSKTSKLWSKDIKELITENPGDIQSYQSLVNVYLETGDTEKAMGLLSEGVMNNPENPEFHLIYGNYLSRFEYYDEAEKEFQTVLDYDAESAEAYNNIGEIYEIMGNHDMAQEYQETARSILVLDTRVIDGDVITQ